MWATYLRRERNIVGGRLLSCCCQLLPVPISDGSVIRHLAFRWNFLTARAADRLLRLHRFARLKVDALRTPLRRAAEPTANS